MFVSKATSPTFIYLVASYDKIHCGAKKTAPFYFCNNFVKTFYSEIIIGTYRAGEDSRMLSGLILRMGKLFWARADVWRLLFCKVTTRKKVARKLRANCSSGEGGSFRLASTGHTYTPINLEQNNIEIINISWSLSLQCAMKCSMCARYQWPISSNIIIVSNIKMHYHYKMWKHGHAVQFTKHYVAPMFCIGKQTGCHMLHAMKSGVLQQLWQSCAHGALPCWPVKMQLLK